MARKTLSEASRNNHRPRRLRAATAVVRQIAHLAGLLVIWVSLPLVLVLLVGGGLYFWEHPEWWRWLWVPVVVGWLVVFIVYRFGKRKTSKWLQPSHEAELHWTRTDTAAWELVRAYAATPPPVTSDEFMSFDLYVNTVRELADRVAHHYHSGSQDALHALTIPEILTAIELATADVRRFVEQYVPGSHLLTIRWLRRAADLPSHWRRIRPWYDAISLIWNPWGVLSRRATQHGVVDPVVRELETDTLATIYQAFVLSAGKYLIELNSHRLRAGPEAWRQWLDTELGRERRPAAEPAGPSADSSPVELCITMVGQTKSGKSSLVNALLGQHRAVVDLLPQTHNIDRYCLNLPDCDDRLVLLDTTGYAHAGPTVDDLQHTMQAACQSAVVILTLHACQPGRQPDLEFLRQIDAWFAEHPDHVKPPILAVVTHIDQLPPPLVWTPPYNWVTPNQTNTKEQVIHDAVCTIRDTFGTFIDGVVPACTDGVSERVFGVEQWIEPAILNLIPRGRGKVLVDVLHGQLAQGRRVLTTATQLWNAATLLAKTGFCGLRAIHPDMPGASSVDE